MKRIGCLLLCMGMLISTCFAESAEIQDEYMFGALENCQNWVEKLNGAVESVKDENSHFMTEKAMEQMLLGQGLLVNALTQGPAPTEEGEETSFASRYAKQLLEEKDGTTLTEVRIGMSRSDSGYQYACDAAYTDQYYRLMIYTYDDKGELLGQRKMELAQKENEMVLVIIAYDADMDYVAKFATWIGEDDAKTVYTRVFGSEMNIVLKPKDWCEDRQTIETWDEDLLLPDQSVEGNAENAQ